MADLPIEMLVVFGAGDSQFNGKYVIDEAARAEGWNRAFRKTDGEQTIHHMKGKEWRLRKNYAENATQYLVKSTACPPPVRGWEVNKGHAPAPTVASEGFATAGEAAEDDGGHQAVLEASLRQLTWPTTTELEAAAQSSSQSDLAVVMLAELREIEACTSSVLRREYEKVFAAKHLGWEDPSAGWASGGKKHKKGKGKSNFGDGAEMLSPRNGRLDLQLFDPATLTAAGTATDATPLYERHAYGGAASALIGLGSALAIRRVLTLSLSPARPPSPPLGYACAASALAVGLGAAAWLLARGSARPDRLGELKPTTSSALPTSVAVRLSPALACALLKRENELRLSEAVQRAYSASRSHAEFIAVTEAVQDQVAREFGTRSKQAARSKQRGASSGRASASG